jgi:hypothetical protein
MRRAVCLVLLLGSAGCPRQDAVPVPPLGEPATSRRLLVSDRLDDWTRGDRFKVTATRDLYVRAVVPSLPETTVMTLEISDPTGAVFYEDHAPFTTRDGPVTVESQYFLGPRLATRAEPVRGGYRLTRLVPILGGPFQRSVFNEGVWQVTARLDGAGTPLTTTIVLSP